MANKDVQKTAIKNVHFFNLNIQKKSKNKNSIKNSFPVFQPVTFPGQPDNFTSIQDPVK
jgi:hypothetical protein